MFVAGSVALVASVQSRRREPLYLPASRSFHPVFDFMRIVTGKPAPIAAGTFGIDPSVPQQPRHYRPAGCPSLEQFEARFRGANDRRDAPRSA